MNTTQTAIVTGASSGIGLGLTKALLSSGYRVVANARRASAAGTLEPASNLVLVDGDVADPEAAALLTRTAVERFGSVDLLVNNAGVFIAKPFTDYTVEEFQSLVRTNTTGFFHVTQPAIRQMRTQASGHVVTISTTMASQPFSGSASLHRRSLNAIIFWLSSTPRRAFASTPSPPESSTLRCIPRRRMGFSRPCTLYSGWRLLTRS